MNKNLISTALLLATAFGLAPAIENTTPSFKESGTNVIASRVTTQAGVSSDKPWYIGPKGGDIRKGYTTVTPNTITNVRFALPNSAVSTERPWFIGPKGGDVRKGAFNDQRSGVIANDPIVNPPAIATARPWYIGPKGGDIRKGH